MDYLLRIRPALKLKDGGKKMQDAVEESLDKIFGTDEFETDWYKPLPTPEARHALAAARSDIPGRFIELEKWLYLMTPQAQSEFNQLINNYSQALANAKRKIREPWRR